jgi:ASC-1-like (ASCH) protein
MNTHLIHCQEPWLSLIKSGQKPVEGRKNSSVYQRIKVVDIITFFAGHNRFNALVIAINSYPDLRTYLLAETVERALPGIKTIEEALAIYHQWNSEHEIRKHGFLAIQIKPML